MSYPIETYHLTKRFPVIKRYRDLLVHPFRRKEITALHNVNLQIKKGEMIALIGHGGSGKSTFASVLAGLFKPQSGEIRLAGKPLAAKGFFPEVSLVFQYPEQQLFANSVIEEVAFGLKNYGISENKILLIVQEALKEVGLDPDKYGQRSPFALSAKLKVSLPV